MTRRRVPLIAGNWKMNTSVPEALELVKALLPGLVMHTRVDRVLCPPFVSLAPAAELLQNTGVDLGAQDVHWLPEGAYTGEVSPRMLKGLCRYVIIGHSERRAHFGETDESVRRKAVAALEHGLRPIVCVGETLDEFDAGVAAEVLARQIGRGLEGVPAEAAGEIVIAYEPVWAIGTGKAASPEYAQDLTATVIRRALASRFGNASGAIRVLYGGSLNAANAAAFFAKPDVDGALVGGASLKHEEFLAIVRAAPETA
jgi:triosephosphate isomerase